MAFCSCEHDGDKIISCCGLHAQWLRNNLDGAKKLLNIVVTDVEPTRANLGQSVAMFRTWNQILVYLRATSEIFSDEVITKLVATKEGLTIHISQKKEQ